MSDNKNNRELDSMEKEYGPTLKISKQTHAEKYRSNGETFREAMNRVASGLKDNDDHFHKFRDILLDMRFLPGGRIQSAIGATRETTPMNCYVSSRIDDSMEGIMDVAKEAALTMKMGGGIGFNFSTLRYKGANIKTLDSHSSGAVSFMHIFDSVAKTICSAGSRRGAIMGVMNVDHPDIEEFIHAKQNSDKLTGFNISIGVTDEFMKAVEHDKVFNLTWKGEVIKTVRAKKLWEQIMRSAWDYAEPGILFLDTINKYNNMWYVEYLDTTNPCFTGDTKVWTAYGPKSFKELSENYDSIPVLTKLDNGEIVFRDMKNPRKTRSNTDIVKVSLYEEMCGSVEIKCTPDHVFYLRDGSKKEAQSLVKGDVVDNVYDGRRNYGVVSVKKVSNKSDVYCGTVEEAGRFFVWLDGDDGLLVSNCGEQPLPENGCCLLGSFNLVKYLYRENNNYKFNWELFKEDVYQVVPAMDNVIDNARFPLEKQRKESINKRRMGLGVTGLSNTIEALGHAYGSDKFLEVEKKILKTLRDECYRASIEVAKSKGPFPLFDKDKYLQSKFVQRLPEDIKEGVEKYGIRNSHLTSIAPAGTISICADNVSSGIEPVFSYGYKRTINTQEGPEVVEVIDYGHRVLGVDGKKSSRCSIDDHLAVLTTAQKYIDSAISKTCIVDGSMPWDEFKNVYFKAWKGLAKGITVFNTEGMREGILDDSLEEKKEGEACTIDPVSGKKTCD